MSEYPVDIQRLEELAATRGGRVALHGFEYQRAFAVLRLVSMLLRQAVKGATVEVPVWLRYEWAEDVDEQCENGDTVLWQCKHGDDWTAPARLAEALIGFSPKWLWTPPEHRPRLHFRLVTSDPAYAAHEDRPGLPGNGSAVREAFCRVLGQIPGARSDRALWQKDADGIGHGTLFDELWKNLRVLHVKPSTQAHANGLWPAEIEALKALQMGRRVSRADTADWAIYALRELLTIGPSALPDKHGFVDRRVTSPKGLRPLDVIDRLHAREPAAPSAGPRLKLIDRTSLEVESARPPEPARYIARQPEWRDVVRGDNDTVGFFERSITDTVVTEVGLALKDSQRLGGKLRVRWLVGAPGAGKSTLALRVAARLVLAGACVAVDARHGFYEDDDAEAWVVALLGLAETPRPLLLLLDDPLASDSAWPKVLRKLSRTTPAIVVLAATPEFLLRLHADDLRDVVCAETPIGRPDSREKQSLARLYPGIHVQALVDADEELLVVTMQVAAGISFDGIIRGIWQTLAGGHALPADVIGDELPWEVAAFLLVVLFHRAYAPCPKPLLEAFLAGRPGVGNTATERLAQVADARGWRIFQLQAPADRWAYMGATVTTMHARVAGRAWELRPARGWPFAKAIADASVREPATARSLALGLAALYAEDAATAMELVEAVAQAWAGQPPAQIDTKNLCALHAVWAIQQMPIPPALTRTLRICAERADAQSWLAALRLTHENQAVHEGILVPSLSYESLIDAADFSLAPRRALQFAVVLGGDPALLQRFVNRLWQAFDGELAWTINGTLLTWLLANDAADEAKRRVDAVRLWLQCNPDVVDVRVALLGLLSIVREEEKQGILAELRTWLAAHKFDTNVRTKYLAHLVAAPQEATAEDIAEGLAFLDRNPSDSHTRIALIKLMRKRGDPNLPKLLEASIGQHAAGRGYQLAPVALDAAASLGLSDLPLIVRWLEWASEVLERQQGKRSANAVANSLRAILASAKSHTSNRGCPADQRVSARAAIVRLRAARTAWNRELAP